MSEQAPHFKKITFPAGPLQCNCTILANLSSKEAIVVDPGGDADKIFALTNEMGVKIVEILHTHAHLDHILASGRLKELSGAPLRLHQDDKVLWDNLESQCMMFNIPFQPTPPPDSYLEHEEDIRCIDGHCLHTPGHTPGSMSFHFPKNNLLIAGDTLFRGSIGRTDLWGGDSQKIVTSIKELYKLDEATTVITGHGPETTLAFEMRNNPFVKA